MNATQICSIVMCIKNYMNRNEMQKAKLLYTKYKKEIHELTTFVVVW